MASEAQRFDLEMPAKLDSLALLARFLGEKFEEMDLDLKTRHAVELAADEAVTNVISYAYDEGQAGTVRLVLERKGGWVMLTIEDNGRPFDPKQAADPDFETPLEDRPIGGLGLYLMEKMMDRVERTRWQGRNRLVLSKRI